MNPETAQAIREAITDLYFFHDERTLDEAIVMQRFGQMCATEARRIHRAMEREEAGVHESLPLFAHVERQEVGAADAPRSGGSNVDPPRNQQGPPLVLHRQGQEEGTQGRPRRDSRDLSALEERTCAVKDTAQWDDLCTCGHFRAMHERTTRVHRCGACDCDRFTKADLTTYDERAAYAKAAQHLTCGIQGCAICAERAEPRRP